MWASIAEWEQGAPLSDPSMASKRQTKCDKGISYILASLSYSHHSPPPLHITPYCCTLNDVDDCDDDV